MLIPASTTVADDATPSPATRDPLPLEESIIRPEGCLCTIEKDDTGGRYPRDWKWLFHPDCPVAPEAHNAYNTITARMWQEDVDISMVVGRCGVFRLGRSPGGSVR
jgi:hypothetical protein